MPSIKLVSTANEGRPLKLCVHPSSTHGTSALSETKLRSRRFVEVVDDPDPNQYPPIVWLIMPIERLRRRLEDRPGLEVEHQHLIDSRLIRVPLHLFVLFFVEGALLKSALASSVCDFISINYGAPCVAIRPIESLLLRPREFHGSRKSEKLYPLQAYWNTGSRRAIRVK